jgi:hypothetical protein
MNAGCCGLVDYLTEEGYANVTHSDREATSQTLAFKIMLGFETSLQPLFSHHVRAHTLLKAVKDMFASNNAYAVISKKRELTSVSMGETESITAYLGRACALREDLANRGVSTDETDDFSGIEEVTHLPMDPAVECA